MSKAPKISVIVPVYKAEKYLHKCVDSLLAQTFTDFEILLIDDGSPDKSGEICDEYALKDNRIRVFHKENGGVSSARQCGLDNARGEYIIHADPDDWVEANMLEELYAKAKEEDADMVICDYWIESDYGSICKTQSITEHDNYSIIVSLLGHKIHGSCWNKLVRKSCFENVKFPYKLDYCEDLYINLLIVSNELEICYLNKAFYHYNYLTSEASITRSSKRALLSLSEEFIRRVKFFLPTNNYYKGYSLHYASFVKVIFLSNEFSTAELRNLVYLWEKEFSFRSELSLMWRLLLYLSVDMYLYDIVKLFCMSFLKSKKIVAKYR